MSEIYIEVCWELFVKVILLVEKLIRVCYCGLEESLHRCGFYVQFEHSFEIAKLKEMN